MRFPFLSLLVVLFAPSSFAQRYDNIWFTGYKYIAPNIDGNFLDFSTSPPIVTGRSILFESRGTQTAMSDEKGNLLFYCNGVRIANAEHKIMMNGDSINWGIDASYQIQSGYALPSSMFALPGFSSKQFFLIYQQSRPHPNLGLYIPEMLYSEIDMSKGNGLGAVVEKDKHLLSTFYADGPNAVRHGNGRDWWIVAPEFYRPLYHEALLNPEGFVELPAQVVGSKPDSLTRPDGGGQNVFSPDGSVYIDYDSWNGIRIFDFNRCTGELSEREIIDFPEKRGFGAGAAISPNSRFLYVTSSDRIFQYDLWADNIAASEDTVATWDGFFSPSPPYVVFLSLPVHPNYRLYDLQGSPCDTLGINGFVSAVEPEPLLSPGDDGIHLAPNPASDFLSIESAYAAAQPVLLRFYDAQGRMVHEQAYPRGVRSYTMDVSGLRPGCYFVEVEMEGGGRAVQRVVILK